jgi:hypothetical protein
MIFTRIGKVFAYVLLLYGVFKIGFTYFYGLSAFDLDVAAQYKAANEYLKREVGEGIMHITTALVLGVLCEINSKSS